MKPTAFLADQRDIVTRRAGRNVQGTPNTGRPPHRTVRAGFPHTAPTLVFDGEAVARPGMKDARSGEPVVRQSLHPLKRHPVPLAASPERSSPKVTDVVAEGLQCPKIRRHRVVVEETGDDLRQPSPLFRDRLMPAMTQLLLANAFFADQGLFTLQSAFEAARHSR